MHAQPELLRVAKIVKSETYRDVLARDATQIALDMCDMLNDAVIEKGNGRLN